LRSDVSADSTRRPLAHPVWLRAVWPRDWFSASSAVARADSDFGSRNPPPDKLAAAGTPKMPVAIMNTTAAAITRRGAARDIRAIAVSMHRPRAGCAVRARAKRLS
jgi:hypothetical protein